MSAAAPHLSPKQTKQKVGFRNVFGMFFNKLTFIQNTVPKEYDAAKHASKVCHEAPVLMFTFFILLFFLFLF